MSAGPKTATVLARSARESSAEVALGAHVPRKHGRDLSPRGTVLNRTGILALTVAGLFAASVLLGSYAVTIPDFFRILAAHLTGGEKCARQVLETV